MAEAQHFHNHMIDPHTGFMENPAFLSDFDAERKLKFLELYKANGLRLRRTSRSMGLSESTVSRHYKIDPVFKKALDDVERDYLEELEATSRENALNPKAFVERIFLLKCLKPEKYGQENRPPITNLTINFGGDRVGDAIDKAKILDAEIEKEIDS